MNFSKILNHPDRDQIISRLTSGESSRDVSAWLKDKYPDDREKQISYNTLNEFRKEHLNIHGAVANDLNGMRVEAKKEEVKEDLDKVVKKNKTYKEKCEELVDTQIDWRVKLLQLLNVVETRFGQLFDRTQQNPDGLRPDHAMIEWMRTILDMVREIRKVEGAPDMVIQHNVTVQAIEEQSALLQEALRQTFAEIDLETSLLLMDKLSENMAKLKAKAAAGRDIGNETAYKRISDTLGKIATTNALPEVTTDDDPKDDDDPDKKPK
jgi:hypothetical protein